MSLAVVPAPVGTDARTQGFYALVKSVHTGMFSNKVNCLFVEVLSGALGRGDPVELIRADGSATSVVGREIREGLGDIVLDLDDPHPLKTDLEDVRLARTPGLQAPPLSIDGQAGVGRLLDAVRRARASGFPAEWARPIKPVAGTTPEELCSFLRGLPDEAVVLLVQKRVRDALAHHDNPFGVMPDCEKAAMHLDAIGLAEDGDRLLLVASAAVQGHKASPALRAAASLGAVGLVGTAEATLDLGAKVGLALGIEMGDAFATAFQSSVKAGGEVMETALLEASRAVGVAWCKGCHDVVQLKFGRSGFTGSRELRCPSDNRKADDALIVVPADAAEVQQALRELGR